MNAEQTRKPRKSPAEKAATKPAPKPVSYRLTEPARKDDSGKVDLSLLPFAALEEVARVLEFGAVKYAPHAWRHLDHGHARYINAALRHLHAHASGRETDPESGLPALAHAAASILFALELPR